MFLRRKNLMWHLRKCVPQVCWQVSADVWQPGQLTQRELLQDFTVTAATNPYNAFLQETVDT